MIFNARLLIYITKTLTFSSNITLINVFLLMRLTQKVIRKTFFNNISSLN